MENEIVLGEVSGAEDIKALEGCTITSITAADDNGEGLCMDCKDDDGNLVSFLITEEGSWHFYNGGKKSITTEQLGEIAMLTGCSDIDSIHFNNSDPLVDIVIKAIGPNAADRVLTILKEIFPRLEVIETKLKSEGNILPMYQCSDLSYELRIYVAVIKDARDFQ